MADLGSSPARARRRALVGRGPSTHAGRWRRRTVLRLTASISVLAPAFAAIGSTLHPPAPAGASTSYAVIGDYPGPNTPALGGLTGGADDACNLGDSAGSAVATSASQSYIPAMNAWQGKPSAVITCYSQIGSSLPSQVPTIWDVFGAIPMLNLDEMFNYDVNPGLETTYSTLQSFGTALGDWVVGTDSLGEPAPAGGRRIYLRWDWEANGNWYAWSPIYTDTAPSSCSALADNEVLYVDRWQQVYNAVMTAARQAAGRSLADNVSWVYSVNAGSALPAALQGCTSPTPGTATVYEPEPGLLGQLGGTQSVTTTGTVVDPADIEASIYPMDDYHGPDYASTTPFVQWVGMDGYSLCASQSPSQIFDSELSNLRSFSSLPVSIDEYGASVVNGSFTSSGSITSCPTGTTAAAKGTWLTQYLDYVQTANIKMSLLFNDDSYQSGAAVDWAAFCQPQAENGNDSVCTGDSSTGTSPTYDVYDEYRQGLASSYFVGADPSNPQVLTTTQFLGQ